MRAISLHFLLVILHFLTIWRICAYQLMQIVRNLHRFRKNLHIKILLGKNVIDSFLDTFLSIIFLFL